MMKNEDPQGRNPYSNSLSHPNVAKELFIRKRNLERERKISPNAFNKNIHPSKRFDDKMTTPTLNRFQGSQNVTMLSSRPDPASKEYKRDFTLMNEELTINVIEEEKKGAHELLEDIEP